MKARSFFRAGIVFVVLLGLGWAGLWVLGRPGMQIKIQAPSGSQPQAISGTDSFSSFGGVTPDQTIGLLVAALEKGDLALAAKYFVPEVREAEADDLKKLNDAQLIPDLIKTLKTVKGGQATDSSHWRYDVTDDTGQPAVEIDLNKNNSGLWKISSL